MTHTVTHIDKPTAGIVYVSPEIAARWLDKNTRNRAAATAVVRKYADDMANGRWVLTGAPIQFSGDRLLDGQHRLMAVIQSDVTVPFFVVRNLDSDAQHYMDIGKKRTVSDQLTLDGVKNASIVAAASRLAYLWSKGLAGKAGSGANVSDAAIRSFLNEHPLIHTAADVAQHLYKRGLDVHPSVIATAWWGIVEAGADPATVTEFFGDLADLRTAGEGDPRKALLRRLQTARRNRERLVQVEALSMVIRTWNAHVRGKEMYRMPALSRNGGIQIPSVRAS